MFPAVVCRQGPPSTEAALKNIVHEIQRRTVWQCLGIYIVGSWIALQVVDVLKDNMGLPDWVFPFAVLLLILGYYSRFADLWADADPELQPRVAAARARAEEIVRARG